MSHQAPQPVGAQRRLRDLAANVERDFDLLKEYEDQLATEDDPRRRMRSRRAIEELRASAGAYQTEYEQLSLELQTQHQGQLGSIDQQLARIEEKIDTLLVGQSDLSTELADMRLAVLSRYSTQERDSLNEIVSRLDVVELGRTEAVLNALADGRLPSDELDQVFAATMRALDEYERASSRLGASESESTLARASAVMTKPGVDVKNKLKLTVPIIPFILTYEGEVGVSSSFGLRSAWTRLVSLVQARA